MKFQTLFGDASYVTSSSPSLSPFFRGFFEAEEGDKATLTAVGLGFFRLFLNGKELTDDRLMPVTSFYHDHRPLYCADSFGEQMKSRINVPVFDLTGLVRKGKNELIALVGPGWYCEFSEQCVFCCKVECGGRVTFSDASFEWCDGPLTAFSMHTGEYHDYCKQPYSPSLLPAQGAEWKPVSLTALPETEYYVQDCPNDRVVRTISPVKIGEKDGFSVYDAGENISGTVVFRLPERGRTVHVTVSEALAEDGGLAMKWNHRQQAEFVTDGTDREYRLLFTWHAFRYFRIESDAGIDAVEVIHTDVAVASSFRSENGTLNWLYETFLRTQLCNMHAGIPSDCPHIERRGYTGDGQLTCETVMLLLDAEKFYRKWIGDISDCQDRNSGHVQYTAPYFRCGGGPGGWGCAIVEVPYQFYRRYGDLSLSRALYTQGLMYLDYLEAHSENDLVTSDQPGLWCLGDWCTPHSVHAAKPEVPEPFVNNYFYIRTCDRLLEIAHLVDRDASTNDLRAQRQRRIDAINAAYFDPETGDYAGNLNSANAFALDIGLGDERTLANLLRHVREDTPDTGIFGIDLTVKVLIAHGYIDDAIAYLTREEYPSFGFMKNNGATTLWEEWKNPRSMSHPMFGAVVKQLFYAVLGITQKEGTTGYRSIVLAPHTSDVTGSISGFVMTPFGKVSVKVDHAAGRAEFTVPAGIDYEVKYDGEYTVTEE